jgi:hypothetical protein
VRVPSPLHYQLVDTLKRDIASPDKTSRSGQEVARRRGVNVSALLVPITATRFKDRKEGNALPRFGSKRTIRETCDLHHKSSAINRGMLIGGGLLWRKNPQLANLPGVLTPHPKRYCAFSRFHIVAGTGSADRICLRDLRG